MKKNRNHTTLLKIVEFFVIKNPADKKLNVKITNYPISFQQLNIIGNRKTSIMKTIIKNNSISLTHVNDISEIEEMISLRQTGNVIILKKDYVSQIDELFRVVRNGLAHGNFTIENNILTCYSFNNKNVINGYVSLNLKSYINIIKIIFDTKYPSKDIDSSLV